MCTPCVAQLLKARQQRSVTGFVIGMAAGGKAVAQSHFQCGLGHVNAHGQAVRYGVIRQACHRPSFQMRTRTFLQLFGLNTSGKGHARSAWVRACKAPGDNALRAPAKPTTRRKPGCGLVDDALARTGRRHGQL